MTDEQLAAIRARCEAATEGPWTVRQYGSPTLGGGEFISGYGVVGPFQRGEQFDSRADAAFIAHARTDIPALLAEVERLRGDAALGSLLREYSDATIEPLAALEHEQWAHWTAYMLSNLTPENINRWLRQIKTPYEQLSPREKNSDREWAEKVLIVLRAVVQP